MTRDEVSVLIAEIPNAVTRNRLTAILGACKTVDEFSHLSDAEALARYRSTPQGETASYDLGAVTYTTLARIQGAIIAHIRDNKYAEQAARDAEAWFTKDELLAIATFMESFKVEKIELAQVHKLLGALQISKTAKA